MPDLDSLRVPPATRRTLPSRRGDDHTGPHGLCVFGFVPEITDDPYRVWLDQPLRRTCFTCPEVVFTAPAGWHCGCCDGSFEGYSADWSWISDLTHWRLFDARLRLKALQAYAPAGGPAKVPDRGTA